MKKPIEEVIKIYFEVKSIRKTAELTGYSKSGVEYLLKANGIQLLPRNRGGVENSQRKAIQNLDEKDPQRLVRDQVYMTELYVNKKMSIPEIAKLLNISRTTVLTGLEQCGIERRNKKDALLNHEDMWVQELSPFHPQRLIRNKIYMEILYFHKNMTVAEIAKSLKLSSLIIANAFKKLKIKLRKTGQSLRGKPRLDLRGPNSPNWKGGLVGWRKLARERLNAFFVRPVMQRDNFTCQWCSSKRDLVVHHHKRSFMMIVNLVRQNCDENNIEKFVSQIVNEHNLDDGITLCKSCHDNYHKENGK